MKLSHEYLLGLAKKDEPRKSSFCKHCHKGGLQWLRDFTEGKWYLVAVGHDGRLYRHSCPEMKDHMAQKKSSYY